MITVVNSFKTVAESNFPQTNLISSAMLVVVVSVFLRSRWTRLSNFKSAQMLKILQNSLFNNQTITLHFYIYILNTFKKLDAFYV